MKDFKTLVLIAILFSFNAHAYDHVIVTVPDQSEKSPEEKQFCIHEKTDFCINSVCRYTSNPECHAQCKKHASAKCNQSPYDQESHKKSETYDKYMDAANTLDKCIATCHKSTDRNCSHQCKESAKKAIKK